MKICLHFDIDITVCSLRKQKSLILHNSHVILGSHRFEMDLNKEGFLENSLEIKSALKSTGKLLNGFEKSLNFTFTVGISTVNRYL